MGDNTLQVFKFEAQQQVRVVIIDSSVWWVAKDVCDILGIQNSRDATSALDEDEKGVEKIDTLGGRQDVSIINESGLYALIVRSNKPEAKKFRKWVTSEVLPSIRKTGEYVTPTGQRKKVKQSDDLARKRLEIQEQNANWRKAKLLFDMVNRHEKVMTPESKIVFLTEAAELASGRDMKLALPKLTEKWYNATEIGKMFDVSANKIGRISNKHGLKAPEGETNEYGTWIRDKSPYSSHETPTWVYFEAGVEWFRNYFAEAKSA